jgi:hypothetical protein
VKIIGHGKTTLFYFLGWALSYAAINLSMLTWVYFWVVES